MAGPDLSCPVIILNAVLRYIVYVGVGRWIDRRNKEIGKETVTILQMRENDHLNQGGCSADGKNALGHI